MDALSLLQLCHAIGGPEAFSERMLNVIIDRKSANDYALMETESVVEEVCTFQNFVNAFLLPLENMELLVLHMTSIYHISFGFFFTISMYFLKNLEISKYIF